MKKLLIIALNITLLGCNSEQENDSKLDSMCDGLVSEQQNIDVSAMCDIAASQWKIDKDECLKTIWAKL